jgi:hypothetical protein
MNFQRRRGLRSRSASAAVQPVPFFAATVLAAVCAACGYVGDPLPPALNIAMPVRDLRVVEYGDRLLIDFTIPPRTTEGVVLKRLGTLDLRIGPGVTPFDTNRWAATARKIPVDVAKTGPVHADVPAADWASKEVVIGVRVVNRKGRPSEWSNLSSVSVVAPLAKPANVTAEADPRGVRLAWQSGEPSFRVFRRGPGEKQPALIGSPATAEYVDATAQFGTDYEYLVQAIHERAESEISKPVSITPKDVFPPAVPAGLNVVASIGSIELVWERNTDSDIRGYRVYRATESGEFQRLAEFTDAPAYSDRQIEAGKKYRYAVSSMDETGNESKMSPAVEITAP